MYLLQSKSSRYHQKSVKRLKTISMLILFLSSRSRWQAQITKLKKHKYYGSIYRRSNRSRKQIWTSQSQLIRAHKPYLYNRQSSNLASKRRHNSLLNLRRNKFKDRRARRLTELLQKRNLVQLETRRWNFSHQHNYQCNHPRKLPKLRKHRLIDNQTLQLSIWQFQHPIVKLIWTVANLIRNSTWLVFYHQRLKEVVVCKSHKVPECYLPRNKLT